MKIETHKPESAGLGYYAAELEEINTPDDIWGHKWYPDIDTWCEDTFGQQDLWGEAPVTGWKRIRNTYFFVKEEQLAWFLIRWL